MFQSIVTMASIGDLLCRTEHLLEKYEKYDTPLSPLSGAGKEGGFEDEVRVLEREIRNLARQAEEIVEIKNRATVAAKNAEIRRTKNTLLQTRLPELQKKLKKGKNLTPSDIQGRQHALDTLADAIRAIPDGIRTSATHNRPGPSTPTRPSAFTRLEGPSGVRAEEYRHTDETRKLEEDWEESKRRQDEALSRIERGVGVLGNLARDMNQEVEIQNPVLDAMEEQLDRVKGEIKTRNQQMRAVLNKMGKTSTLCFDLTLIVILLALAAYIYSLVT